MNLEINDTIFETFPQLESERLFYKQFQEDDAETLFEIRANNEVMEYMDSYPEPDILSMKEKIKEMNLSFHMKLGINWAIFEKLSSKMIGYFGIWKLDRDNCRGEIGYALSPDFWGKGFMGETFKTIIPFGFQKLHLHSFEANVNPLNMNSIRILEKQCFKKEAYFRENYLFDGKFIDSIIYSILESDIL